MKIGLEVLPPLTFAGLHFGVATIVLLVILKVSGVSLPRDRRVWLVMVFLGLFQVCLPFGIEFWGVQYIPSGLASVLFATNPFFVMIFASFIVRSERITIVKLAGVITSFLGLSLIFWPDIVFAQGLATRSTLLGEFAVLGSAVSSGFSTVVAKRFAGRIHPTANVCVQDLIGAIVLSSVGLLSESGSKQAFTPVAIAAVLYLGIFLSGLAFLGMYWLLTKTTATNVSMISFITPIIALILGWAVLYEIPTLYSGMGAALILVGVYLTVKSSS
jgi:drug/metabolite transporter (DMT)-like permease